MGCVNVRGLYGVGVLGVCVCVFILWGVFCLSVYVCAVCDVCSTVYRGVSVCSEKLRPREKERHRATERPPESWLLSMYTRLLAIGNLSKC